MDDLRSLWIQNGYSSQHKTHGVVFNVGAVLADCLFAGESVKEKTTQNKIADALAPFRAEIDAIAIRSGGGHPRRATLETIVTMIFPLLARRKYPTLQYYIDLWKDDQPQDNSVQQLREDRSVSPDLSRLQSSATGHAETNEAPFNRKGARNVVYRQEWLTTQVRSALCPHLMRNEQEVLYNCIDLIAAAIPTSRHNVNVKVWPRLLNTIEGCETTNPFVVHLRQNWERVQMNDDDGWMSIPDFDEFMWRALATGQPNSIPAMIRNADTLNGYATGVGSAVAHVENERLHADYATNASAEQRVHLQRRANQAEQVMDPFLRDELQGSRTTGLISQSVADKANLRLQLELFQANPTARIAEAESKARVAEAESKAREADANARTAEAIGKAREEEAKAKIGIKNAEWQAKHEQQERKFKHDRDMLDARSAKRTAIGLRSIAPPLPLADLKGVVPGVEDQFHPKSTKEVCLVALWNTLEPGSQTQKVLSTHFSMVQKWFEALKLKLVPNHDRYDMALMKTYKLTDSVEATKAFQTLFTKSVSKMTKSAVSIIHGPYYSESGTFEASTGVRIRHEAYWPQVIQEAAKKSSTNQ